MAPDLANTAASYIDPPKPSFLFDLDGTLIDSVYQHVIAWRTALARLDIDLSVWRIHRRVGESGGLFGSAPLRGNRGVPFSGDIALLQIRHRGGDPGPVGAGAPP